MLPSRRSSTSADVNSQTSLSWLRWGPVHLIPGAEVAAQNPVDAARLTCGSSSGQPAKAQLTTKREHLTIGRRFRLVRMQCGQGARARAGPPSALSRLPERQVEPQDPTRTYRAKSEAEDSGTSLVERGVAGDPLPC
jgi:hypothetical protein